MCIWYPYIYIGFQGDENIDLGVKTGSLASRLRLDPKKDRDFVPLPVPLLRKYIAYARTFVFPRWFIVYFIHCQSHIGKDCYNV